MAKYNKKWIYNMDDDYGNFAKEAAARGDMTSAENYERTRNYKIDNEGLDYEKTYDYIDIGTDIKDAMANGESGDYLRELTNARENKALNNTPLNKYYDDEIQRNAKQYIYNDLAGIGGNYQNRPQYNEVYTKEVDDLVRSILGREEFEYDVEDDPSYQAYKEAALREGQRAMQNTLTNYSQMAGGMNSYAVSAAQQAMNNHLAQLNDKIPELYQDAYNRYLNEYAQDKDDLNTLLNVQANEYNKYLNDMNQFNINRDWATQMANNEYAQNYQQRRDQIADEKYQKEWDYGIAEAEKAQNREYVNQILLAGGMPTDEMLLAAGFNSLEEAQAYAQTMSGYYAPRNDLELEGMQLGVEGQRINNQLGNKELQWYDAKAAKSLSSGSKNSSGSSAGSKTVKAAAEYINDRMGYDVIADKGNNEYKVTKDGKYDAVKALMSEGVYSIDETFDMLSSMGMSEEEIEKYANEVEEEEKLKGKPAYGK